MREKKFTNQNKKPSKYKLVKEAKIKSLLGSLVLFFHLVKFWK